MNEERSVRSNKIVRANKSRKLARLERDVGIVKSEIKEVDILIEKGGEGA